MSQPAVTYAYERTEQRIHCKLILWIALALAVLGFVFFSMYGAFFIPYLDAYGRHQEAQLEAQTFSTKLCSDPAAVAGLGRHGQKRCAEWAYILEVDPGSAAVRAVLDYWNICVKGECLPSAFNVVQIYRIATYVIPAIFMIVVLLAILMVGYCVHGAYTDLVDKRALPFNLAFDSRKPIQYASFTGGKEHSQ